jgi:hypothetical protein
VWSPFGNYPSSDEMKERNERINEILEQNAIKPFGRDTSSNNMNFYLNLFRSFYERRLEGEDEE